MQLLTENKNIRLSKEQKETLDKLAGYGVNANHFIRLAIKEKLERDCKKITKKKRVYCPF